MEALSPACTPMSFPDSRAPNRRKIGPCNADTPDCAQGVGEPPVRDAGGAEPVKSIFLHHHRSVRAERRRATDSTGLCLLTSFLYLIISSVDGGEEGLAPGTGMDGHQSHPRQRDKGQGS